MTVLQHITFHRKQLPLRGQKVLPLQLQEDFDDFGSSLLKGYLCCKTINSQNVLSKVQAKIFFIS